MRKSSKKSYENLTLSLDLLKIRHLAAENGSILLSSVITTLEISAFLDDTSLEPFKYRS